MTKNGKNKDTDLLIHHVPKGLKARFKAACGKNGISMRLSIINWMRRASRNGR